MSSPYTSHSSSLANLSNAASASTAASVIPTRTVPAGTLPPGTLVTVGKHNVTIERWLSEGGFAHVYVVRLKEKMKLADGSVGDVACLKRVIAPDKEALGIVRTEVDTMKRLKGHRHVVTYIDSHACELAKGGYEVFLLMEFCSGGGLIDFMNTRLQDRLTESEILKIFGDVAQGVACMHYLQPPLLHRDIKVENVLIASSRCYKLCDFGSSAPPRLPGTSGTECRAIEEDIQKHTTLQYRSPEMVDVYRRLPIDEKSDIWALGVFLYKLCYYTTPFEDKGTLAILNATFTFPSFPSYSTKIKNLIAWTLREKPTDRPNIYEVVKAVCILRGSEIPIRDIYSGPTATQPIPTVSSLPKVSPLASPPPQPVYQASVTSTLPVEPMRRGRPIKTTPSPQPITLTSEPEPWVKLPSTSVARFEFTSASEDDDIASRFPTIEELSGGAFTSSTPNRSKSQPPPKTTAAEEVDALADDAFALPVQPYRKKQVDALADDAFKPDGRPSPAARIRAALEREKGQTEWVEPILQASPESSDEEEEERVLKPSEVIARGGVYANQQQQHQHHVPPPHPPVHSTSAPPTVTSPADRIQDARALDLRRKAEESRRIIDESRKILEEQWPDTKEPVPERPQMVSIGVGTSPPPSPPKKPKPMKKPPPSMILPPAKILPTEPRSPGLSTQKFSMQETELRPIRSKTPIPSPAKQSPHKEYIRAESPRPKSRAGFISDALPSPLGKGYPTQRPQSLYVDNDLEFLRSYDAKPLEKSHTGLSTSSQPVSLPSTSELHPVESEQDLEFLRHKDEETRAHSRQVSDHLHRERSRNQLRGISGTQPPPRRSSSSEPSAPKHIRQTSLGALSKGIMSGKFGDAFRKFEGFGGSHHETKVSDSRLRAEKTLARRSPEEEAIEDDDGEDWRVETHDIPVKMKQHLSDTRKISAERETRPIIIGGESKPQNIPKRAISTTGASKAKMIQQRMNEYLNSQNNEKPPPLTADGYGPYITDARAIRNPVEEEEKGRKVSKGPGVLPKPNILRRPSLKGSVD